MLKAAATAAFLHLMTACIPTKRFSNCLPDK
jgi:hypothetical protein